MIDLYEFNKRFDKVVIWGHKLHSHTHSYVMNGFYRTLKHIGINVYWFDDNDKINDVDFNRTLFITEGQVDKKIPITKNSFYVLHNCCDPKYKVLLESKNAMVLQVYTDDVLKYNLFKVDNCIYEDVSGKCLYQPWATDLLPDEIDANKISQQKEDVVWWVGTIGGGEFGNINEINPFKKACEENGIEFRLAQNKSAEESVALIKKSYLAPAIVGTWQHRQGYVPCRIFKNISYGKMGITNSPRVHELFDKKIIHNNDTYKLYYDAEKYIKDMSQDELYSLMDLVKEKHTYINRINEILYFISKIKGN